ncbi:hypothetical protein [Streptomyces sp. NPDC090025]|uniref:hypothetical protein n=1 Tax=Streptomyces sp. NPDC090025 TaxID=3365922 RepID=UPI003833A2DB
MKGTGGFLTGGVAGAALAALVVGVIVESVPLFVGGLLLPLGYGVAHRLATAPGRRRELETVPVVALARIDARSVPEHSTDKSSDVPVEFHLEVVPDDGVGAAFRVEVRQDIDAVDLPDHRPGGVVAVRYPPGEPWRARIVRRPTPAWAERIAEARLDAVPGAVRVTAPPDRDGAACVLGAVGLLLGAACVVVPLRGELFGPEAAEAGPTPTVTSSSSSTVVVTGAGTVTIGAGQSFRDPGELRRAVDSLVQHTDTRQVLTVIVKERVLTYVPAASGAPGFDVRTLPFDRIPGLITEATTDLGVRAPQEWQVTAEKLTGSVTVRVSVTGAGGTALLEADGKGEVVRRVKAH